MIGESLRIGYLIPRFPVPSETFILNEVDGVSRLIDNVSVAAFAAPTSQDMPRLDPRAKAWLATTEYISRATAATALARNAARVPQIWYENIRVQQTSTGRPHLWARLAKAVAVARVVERAGVTHLHAHWPYASGVAYLVHRLTGIPFSIGVHAHEVEHENGHFPLVLGAVSFAVFCNRAAMERLLTRVATVRTKCHVVYHGVDLSRFPHTPIPSLNGTLRVISIGRMTRTKGFVRLVRACAAAQRLGLKCDLTLLGDGAGRREIVAAAAELGVAEDVRIIGWVPHHEIQNHIRQSHILALAADVNYHDGLPNVVLEAMACGRPVILSPLPAAAEAVTHDVEGIVLRSADDIAGMTAAFDRLIREPAALSRMGTAARRRVESSFDSHSQVQLLTSLFRSHHRVPVPA